MFLRKGYIKTMSNTASYAAELLAAAQQLLDEGYLEEITAELLAEYALDAQFATLDADEPGGANSWSDAECQVFFEHTKAALIALGLK